MIGKGNVLALLVTVKLFARWRAEPDFPFNNKLYKKNKYISQNFSRVIFFLKA